LSGIQVYQDAFEASDLPQGGVVTIGNYDGVHRGQRAVLERVVTRARAAGGPAVVVSFDPHPLAVLGGRGAPARLTTEEQKTRLLEAIGIDALVIVRFTRVVAQMFAEDFVRSFLRDQLRVREIYVGEGFAFGRGRKGDLALLRRLGERDGFLAEAVPPVTWRGERISSSRIREAILEGRVEDAREMLGRAYAITGVVGRGDRMGKRLGWPTINVVPDHPLVPANGVYACRVSVASFPVPFDCATNVGTRPTVYEHYTRVVEGHILDFHADVYGERVELEFHRRLREEKMFPTVMDLAAQISRDVDATREYFELGRRLERSVPATAAVEGRVDGGSD
jgi:riboflavin kinase/FMN adenylyltransferase